MSSRSQDASGYSMTRYKQWNTQRKGYNRQPNSPESDLTNTSSTEMNSSSMRRAIRSQYRRMQEVIAALRECVCVSSVWTATENPPGTRQSLIRANKGERFASPNNLIILISRFRWSAAGPQCARFVVIARFYASDTQVTRRVWHARSSCTVAQRSPSARGARRRKKLQSFLFIAVILKVKLMNAHLSVNWVRLRYGNYCRGGAEMSLSPPLLPFENERF